MIRIFLGAAVAGIAAAAVPAQAAQSVTFTSAGIYDPGHVDVTIGGTTINEFAAPLHFTETSVRKGTFDALGFCVDLPHLIYVGVGYQLKQTLAYHVAPLTGDGYGNGLSTGQVRQITGLAALGFKIAKGSAADKSAQLAAIQQSIWTIEYPTATFAATGAFAATQAGYVTSFLRDAPRLGGFARTLISDDGRTQAQITDVGGVPEPAVWAQLLAGFGVVGILGRRRRTTMATVAA